ncbi:MAG: sigma-70 family RNA polymerase sigma factor [Bacteroidetes bacterium]|nr:MAG: sigma-70 family RNA polymerase sigma factor [Bacteroidota bacterium]
MKEENKDPLFEIIEGCVKGDSKCQQIIYQKFYGKMLGACMRYSKNREEAKDILQDGFIKVFINIKLYRGSGSFEGWIRKVIINTALDYIRKNKQLIQYADSDYVEENAEDPSATLGVTKEEDSSEYSNISMDEIMKAVQQLPAAYRTVFNLFVVDGFSHQEIATQLGINIGTSKSNLSKAKMNLKKYFRIL